jgi:hypothetical protein
MQQHKAVEVEIARRGFDAQRKTGGGGRPALMASQQVERAVELQDPEVRTELNRRVRECERKCSAGGRLGLVPQASAHTRQQTTRKRVGGQWYESRMGAVALRVAAQACLQCTHRSSSVEEGFFVCEQERSAGHALATHVRERRKLSL